MEKVKSKISLNVISGVIVIAVILGSIFIINKIVKQKEVSAVSEQQDALLANTTVAKETSQNTKQNESTKQMGDVKQNPKENQGFPITVSSSTNNNTETNQQEPNKRNIQTNINQPSESPKTNEQPNTEQNTNQNNQAKNKNQKENAKSAKVDKGDPASKKGVIYLTFDDGPSSTITPKILDILKKEKIKATFFVINYSDANEKYLKRAVKEGHTIGIHGYSHEYSKIYKSKETFMENVYSLQKKIQKSTGVKTMYVRFPGGSSNTISKKYCKGVMTDLAKELLSKGFKYYDWNICAEDAGSAKNAKDVYNNTIKYLSKKRGNMVLMHDFGNAKKTLEALPEIIKYAKKNGYTFAAIDDTTPMFAQHINN